MKTITSTIFLCLLFNLTAQNLTQKLEEIKSKYNAVGMSIAVVKNDSILFNEGFGKRDVNRNLNIDDSTFYRIASVSKMVTATALMILHDEGLFKLDDDVSEHLGFTLRNPNYPNDVITVEDILNHTSSLRDGSAYDNFLSATYNNYNPPNIIELLTPGGEYYNSSLFSSTKRPAADYFNYANINYGVVGTLVEKLSGQRFDQFCKDRIFVPLNMSVSFNVTDLPNINNSAVLYRRQGSNWIPQAENYLGVKPPPRNLNNYEIGNNGLIFAPQGGLRCSSYDLSKFMIMHMNNGIYKGTSIISDSAAQLMHKPSWIFNGSNGNNYYGIFNAYGIGNNRTSDLLPGEELFGHPGEAYGLISDLYFSKEKDYGIIFITNGGEWGYGDYSGWYNIEEEIFNACLDELENLTVGGINNIENNFNFVLEQNYPNPFNPCTSIEYSVPKVGTNHELSLHVTLRVYDILGNEVAELVNEIKDAGEYKINFDASALSSGIYFYQLQAGSIIQTKKLILLK